MCIRDRYKVAEDLLFNTNVVCSEKFERASLIPVSYTHLLTQELYQVVAEYQKKCDYLHVHAMEQNVQLGRALAKGCLLYTSRCV